MIGKVWQSLKYPHVIGKISNYHMASNCLKIKKVSVFHRYHDYMFPYFNNGSFSLPLETRKHCFGYSLTVTSIISVPSTFYHMYYLIVP